MYDKKIEARIKSAMKRDQEAYKIWGKQLLASKKIALLKNFLILSGIEQNKVNLFGDLSEYSSFISKDLETAIHLTNHSFNALNEQKYLQIRPQIALPIEVQGRKRENFKLLSLKFEEMGYRSDWPSYLMNSQTSIASTLTSIVPLRDRECFDIYVGLCKNKELSYARVPLVWVLFKFKNFQDELEQIMIDLHDDESIRLSLLHPIEKLKITHMIPILKKSLYTSDELYNREALKTINKLKSF